jgi:hypothetical protein
MPKCPKCHKPVSWLDIDLFGGGCRACVHVDPGVYEEMLAVPCGSCGSQKVYATAAPALGYICTPNGNLPLKVSPGLFILGCADCGAAWWRFNEEGRMSLPTAAGWVGRDQLARRRSGDQGS